MALAITAVGFRFVLRRWQSYGRPQQRLIESMAAGLFLCGWCGLQSHANATAALEDLLVGFALGVLVLATATRPEKEREQMSDPASRERMRWIATHDARQARR